jgi:alpha-1,6-mannosyltransferase
MKICDLTQVYALSGSDINNYLEEKQNYLRKHEEHENIHIMLGQREEILEEKNLKTYHIARLPKVLSILKQEKPDVIEFGSPYILPHAGFYSKRKFASVLVGFYHMDFPAAFVESSLRRMISSRLARGAISMVENYVRSIYNRFDVTLTSSATLTAKLTNMGVERVKRISLGLDLDMFHPGKRDHAFRNSLGITDTDVLLIYTGRLDECKCLRLVLDAFNHISEYFQGKLLLIGDGSNRNKILNAGRVTSKIHYFPAVVDKAKLARMFASSDIYVTARPHETSCLAIARAQACGLPVVGVSANVLREKLPEYVGVVGPEDSAHDMAMNILRLASRNYRAIGEIARERVEQEFPWDRTFAQLFRLYKRLIKQRSTAH